MAADGSPGALAVGLAVVAIVIALAVRERTVLGLSRLLAIVLMLGLVFKEGYVRQDPGHLAVFFCGAALLSCVVLLAARLRYSAIAALVVTAFALFLSDRLLVSTGNSNPVARVLPVAVALNLRDALVPRQISAAALAPDTLPASAAARLRSFSVDLVGNEENVVFANGLNWSPEPVFQARNAYAPSLDALNRDSLRSSPLRRELVEFDPVDNRYPVGDEPFVMRSILCGDALDSQFAQPIATSSGDDAFLVLKPSTARCGPERTISGKGAMGRAGRRRCAARIDRIHQRQDPLFACRAGSQ